MMIEFINIHLVQIVSAIICAFNLFVVVYGSIVYLRKKTKNSHRLVANTVVPYATWGLMMFNSMIFMAMIKDPHPEEHQFGKFVMVVVVAAIPVGVIINQFIPWSILDVRLIRWNRRLRPNLISIQPAVGDPSDCILVGHISDLHLTKDTTIKSDIPGPDIVRPAAASMRWLLTRAQIIAITGDITDQGRGGDWHEFLNLLDSLGAPLSLGSILIVPGNHDLSLVPSDDLGVEFDARAFNFISAVLTNCSPRWTMWVDGKMVGVRHYLDSVSNYLDTYRRFPPRYQHTSTGEGTIEAIELPIPLLKAAQHHKSLVWPGDPVGTKSEWVMCTRFLRLAYPMILHEDEHFFVLGLNSSDFIAGKMVNFGLGQLGKCQTSKLKEILEFARDRCVIILLHHHLDIPREVLKFLTQADVNETKRRDRIRSLVALISRRIITRSLALIDAAELTEIVSKLPACIIFHGHKHIRYATKLGNATVVAGPSIAYGDQSGAKNCVLYRVHKSGRVEIVDEQTFD